MNEHRNPTHSRRALLLLLAIRMAAAGQAIRPGELPVLAGFGRRLSNKPKAAR
jgi:hypothetical protein